MPPDPLWHHLYRDQRGRTHQYHASQQRIRKPASDCNPSNGVELIVWGGKLLLLSSVRVRGMHEFCLIFALTWGGGRSELSHNILNRYRPAPSVLAPAPAGALYVCHVPRSNRSMDPPKPFLRLIWSMKPQGAYVPCSVCKSAHHKCDGKRPCSRCVRLHRTAHCIGAVFLSIR